MKCPEDIVRFKEEIRRYWEITDNGPIRWFLGFQIERDRSAQTISINQSTYIQGIVDKFRLTNSAPVVTPMVHGETLSSDQSPATPT